MTLGRFAFSQEPAVYIAVLTALIGLGVGFGLPITHEQSVLLVTAFTVLSGVVIRSQVTPVANVAKLVEAATPLVASK